MLISVYHEEHTAVLQMPENLPAGGAVGSVLATDPDGANNGNVSQILYLKLHVLMRLLIFFAYLLFR